MFTTTTSISESQSNEVRVTTTKTLTKSVNTDCKEQETPSPVVSSSGPSLFARLFSKSADLTEKISSSFESKYNRKPTQDEINKSIQASVVQHLTNLQSEANDEESDKGSDSDYSPDNEDDKNMELSDLKDLKEYEAQKCIDKEDEEKSVELPIANGVVKSTSEEDDDDVNDDEQRKIVESAEFEKVFSEAIESVKQLALADREKVFDRVRSSLEESTGEKVTDEELLLGFEQLQSELFENDEEYEVDPTFEISEEELQQEIAEAMSVVRDVARIDGAKLADKVRETFSELNDRDPTEEEIQSVFDRVKDELAEEAEEDALEAIQEEKIRNLIETTSDESTPVSSTLTANALTIDTANEVSIEFLEYARETIAQDLQRQAYVQLAKLIPDRVPTISEINDTILSICETEFFLSSSEIDSTDYNDSDYDPEIDDDAQYLLDRDEDDEEELEEQFDDEEVDEDDEDDDDDEEEDDDVDDYLPLKSLPVLTTPLRQGKTCARVDFYFESTIAGVSPSLKSKAIANFEKSYDREPNNDELKTLLNFLTTEETEEAE